MQNQGRGDKKLKRQCTRGLESITSSRFPRKIVWVLRILYVLVFVCLVGLC